MAEGGGAAGLLVIFLVVAMRGLEDEGSGRLETGGRELCDAVFEGTGVRSAKGADVVGGVGVKGISRVSMLPAGLTSGSSIHSSSMSGRLSSVFDRGRGGAGNWTGMLGGGRSPDDRRDARAVRD